MKNVKRKKLLSLFLSVVMICSSIPFAVFAQDTESTDWETFLSDLQILEEYADAYASENTDYTSAKLMINYIRTGVEKYSTDSWATIAGDEYTDFVTYVSEQDAANETTASELRGNIDNIVIPNGQTIDLAHLFGALNISSFNSYSNSWTDFGSWAGDLCDLLEYSSSRVTSTDLDDLVTEIAENYFGIDDESESSFGAYDLYSDLDCYYISSVLSQGNVTSLTSIIDEYYTTELSNVDRAAYFLNNRFSGYTTQDDIRAAILDAYSNNTLVKLLESDRSISDYDDIRTACCYVFADYLYDLAADYLNDTGNDDDNGDTEDEETSDFTVFSSTSSTLAPGVTQEINYALDSNDKQVVYYTATVDITRDDVDIYANYNNNDPSEGWAMSTVSSQMTAAQEKHSDASDEDNYIENYNAVLGINGDYFNMSTGKPSGVLVMNGVEYNPVNSYSFFAILDDGTPVIASSSEWDTYADRVVEAVGGRTIIVKDGEITETSTSKGCKTCVGITEDGKVVMMVIDGRQEPFSAGATPDEAAQLMIDAGCVIAMKLDEGGSSTYVAKSEGEDEISVINSPSDGYERSISSSLLVVSTAETSNEFDHALITTDTDYLTIGSTLDVTVTGVSSTGNAAELPENAYLQVSDESIGTIDGTTFTAVARGSVDIQLVVDGEVVGSKTLTVIRRPDTLTFTKSSINAIYGESVELPLQATYNSNPVTINANDITFTFSTSSAGTMDGFSFIGDESSGLRKVTVTAAVTSNLTVEASMVVCLYSSEESIFDFDTAMYGDESLAWNRDVSNTITLDNTTYYTIDTTEETAADYTFALDIQSIEAPEQLAPLMTYLSGFAGTSGDSTPWDFLLALAARVNTQTNVTISVNIPEGVDVDITNLSVVNDYFTLTSAEFDESTRKLTVICNWVKQTSAIDPDTANSICILSGITLTPNEDAVVDENNCVTVGMSGTVSYDIYLRSSQLYSLANNESNQEEYGIYPYYDPDDSAGYYGGHFYDTYITFNDSFYVCNEALNGWVSTDEGLYYYVDNEYLTGVQLVPAYQDEDNSYYYNFDSNGVCLGLYTGLFEYNNDTYYAVNGVLKSGWREFTVDGEEVYYYFDLETYKGLNGEDSSFFSGVTYEFENGKLVSGVWLTDDNGSRYYYGPSFVQGRWYTIDSDLYYFDSEGYRYEGYRYVQQRDDHESDVYWYDFGDDGICKGILDYTGLLIYEGETYYLSGGLRCNGLYLAEDGYYYYFSTSNYAAVKDVTYWVSYPNETGFAQAFYYFDENGRMVIDSSDPDEEEIDTSKNGIIDEDGTLYYYVDGVKTYAGLIEIDGDYYYVNSSCIVVTDCRYWISKTNDLLPATFYYFDEDGKMIVETSSDDDSKGNEDEDTGEDTGTVKNGIVDEDGTLYYYVDGVKTYAGLIEIDGDYYYVNSSCIVVTDCRYWISKTNDLLPATFYYFDEDGKMIVETSDEEKVDTTKNGIVEEDGTLYYYVDGVKTYAGLIQIDGDYYYVNSSCIVVTDCRYWISKTNDLLPATFYYFDEDGKMIVETSSDDDSEDNEDEDTGTVKNGIVAENGSLYYYVDGVITYVGLIQIDGNYYYVRSSGEVVNNCTYTITWTHGLLDAGTYTFDENGVMNTDTETVKNGIVAENGSLYYYVDGVITYVGLIQIDGDYYYVRSSGEVVNNCTYTITWTHGLMDAGTYTFDEDGKMVID